MLRMALFAAICSMFAGCGKEPVKLSDEQIEHKKSVDRCFSLLVEAGAKWHQGGRVGDICAKQNPARPEQARIEIMATMAKSGLIAQNLYAPYQLPDGECKQAAEKFISLHEKAWALNGDAKQKALAEAFDILDAATAGKCTAAKN